MAVQITPQPFQTGPRLVGGEALNFAIANPAYSSQYNATANGTTKATGTAITAHVTHFGTVASSGVAVLPLASAGLVLTVFNYGANTLTIYPNASADTIDSAGAGASVSLSTTSRGAEFYCVSPGVWLTAIVGATTS